MARRNPGIEDVEKELDENIRDGMADALWESAYATWAEEAYRDATKGRGTGYSLRNMLESMPPTPKVARKAASDLAQLIADAHKGAGHYPLVRLLELAFEAQTGRVLGLEPATPVVDLGWNEPSEATLSDLAMSFGFLLAMQSMGNGVSWFDDHKQIKGRFDDKVLALPKHFECYYDGVYLRWSGGDAVVTHAHPQSKMPRFLVLRVDGDTRDAYAVAMPDAETGLGEQGAIQVAFDQAMDVALPDEGALLEFVIVHARDASAARLNAQRIDEDEWGIAGNAPEYDDEEPQQNPKCAVDHAALEADPVQWKTLRLRGVQESENEEEDGPSVELRDCPVCKTTLSMPLSLARRSNPSRSRRSDPELMQATPEQLAAAVREVMPSIGTAANERYGARKVFISAVYRTLARQGRWDSSLDAFKQALVRANRAGLVELARADLVGAMPSATVKASETHDDAAGGRGAEYHFVVDPTAREAWERNPSGNPGSYRVVYLVRAVRTVADMEFPTAEHAAHAMRAYKRRGMTAWVEDASGTFVPVAGALRQPAHRVAR